MKEELEANFHFVTELFSGERIRAILSTWLMWLAWFLGQLTQFLLKVYYSMAAGFITLRSFPLAL